MSTPSQWCFKTGDELTAELGSLDLSKVMVASTAAAAMTWERYERELLPRREELIWQMLSAGPLSEADNAELRNLNAMYESLLPDDDD